ncbi:diguanylate cyclase [Alteromonas confluentis]|uniref:Diguanylate cyclase n=1 Tax=Alteromonas confluentis TaxID=1656094 RepID=A0A1E7Z7M4_9ALTE|nr:diguanylate cyclase [Alteromonas confluentis]
MFRSIKLPITLLVTAVVSVSVVATFYLSARSQDDRIEMLEKQKVSNLSDNIAMRIASESDTSRQNVIIDRELALLENSQANIAAYIFDEQKRLLGSSGGGRSEEMKQLALKHPYGVLADDDLILSVSEIGSDYAVEGTVVVISDLSDVKKQSQQVLAFQTLPELIAVIIIAVVIAFLIIQVLLKPLNDLIDFTRKISRNKDYTARFLPGKSREISSLVGNINSFLDTIEVELTINKEQNATLVEQQQTMMRLANYDSLTALPNRQFVVDNLRLELARVRRLREDLALIFFDLDGFKSINDSLGHETGDLILIEVADRVQNLLREGDLVARLGGDEFIIVPDRDVSDVSLNNLATKLVSAFEEPFMLRGLALSVGVSVGIARATDAGYELSQLMSNADLAMYRSKAKGRGTHTLFTVDMVESYKRKMSLANSIDSAIRHDEFRVYYQPKISKHGAVIGLEALIRWEHPEYGMVMPGEFVPIAEQGGRISSITQWMIERVCMELPDLQMLVDNKFRVAINLSGHDLRHTDLFNDIYELFERYKVHPEYFEFEVTESSYLENFDTADKFFKRLSNMGCAIALDDFGTGYSSLSYLTQITIDTLKIDRQFICELESSERSRMVTGSIIDLAKRLALTVCAEGIEQPSQWRYLNEHGCDHVQGFLFSKPVPLSKLIELPKNFSHFLDDTTSFE